jgi:hypothetical protein
MLVLAIACLVLYGAPYLLSTKLTVSDEIGIDHFSSLYAETGSLSYLPEGDRIFGIPGFIPWAARYLPSGEAVPKQPPGFILLVAAVKKLLPGQWFLLLNPLLGLFCVLLYFDIARSLLGDQRTAVIATLLLATTPAFVHWCQMLFVDIANLALFLLAMSLFLRFTLTRDARLAGALGLSLGAMLWVRQSSVVLLVPLAALFFAYRRCFTLRSGSLAVVGLAIAIGGLLIYQAGLYGDPFLIGYSLPQTPVPEVPVEGGIQESLKLSVRVKPDTLIHRLQWLVPALTLAFPPLLLALPGMVCTFRQPHLRSVALLAVGLLSVLLLLFGGRSTYGTDQSDMTLQSSFLRYLLPVIALLPLFAATAMTRWGLSRWYWLVAVLAINLGVATLGRFGTVHTVLNRLYHEDVAQFVLDSTGKDTVIISPYWSHLVFPQRLFHKCGQGGRGSRHLQLLPTVEAILEKGYRVGMIYHRSDQAFFAEAEKVYNLDYVAGPQRLHPLLEWLPIEIPPHIYPARLAVLDNGKGDGAQSEAEINN